MYSVKLKIRATRLLVENTGWLPCDRLRKRVETSTIIRRCSHQPEATLRSFHLLNRSLWCQLLVPITSDINGGEDMRRRRVGLQLCHHFSFDGKQKLWFRSKEGKETETGKARLEMHVLFFSFLFF